jgi:hypothetical protein
VVLGWCALMLIWCVLDATSAHMQHASLAIAAISCETLRLTVELLAHSVAVQVQDRHQRSGYQHWATAHLHVKLELLWCAEMCH